MAAKPLSEAQVNKIVDDLVIPVADLAALMPTNAWPEEIRTLIGAARIVAKRWGIGVVNMQ